MKQPCVILIRGLPGSGKTTLAKQIAQQIGADHWEADQYFTAEDGTYNFNARDLDAAHAYCAARTYESMLKGNLVVVSNTFVKQWEMKPYRSLAKEFGYELYELKLVSLFGNVHNVPEEVIERMRNNWED